MHYHHFNSPDTLATCTQLRAQCCSFMSYSYRIGHVHPSYRKWSGPDWSSDYNFLSQYRATVLPTERNRSFLKSKSKVILEFYMGLNTNNESFWDVTPFILVESYELTDQPTSIILTVDTKRSSKKLVCLCKLHGVAYKKTTIIKTALLEMKFFCLSAQFLS